MTKELDHMLVLSFTLEGVRITPLCIGPFLKREIPQYSALYRRELQKFNKIKDLHIEPALFLMREPGTAGIMRFIQDVVPEPERKPS